MYIQPVQRSNYITRVHLGADGQKVELKIDFARKNQTTAFKKKTSSGLTIEARFQFQRPVIFYEAPTIQLVDISPKKRFSRGSALTLLKNATKLKTGVRINGSN